MMIRLATLDDIPRLVELGRVMHASAPGFSRMRFDPERLASTIANTIGTAAGFARVAERGGVVTGGMLAVATPHYFSPDLVACDLALFIDPAHRGGIAAAQLVQAYVQWAHDIGAALVHLGLVAGDAEQNEATARLCERLGARRAGLVMEF
jgi:RimJ/RimL family protein N-acetyltransferase